MHPYRELPTAPEPRSAPSEEHVLYAILCAIGAIPVVVSLLGDGFGVEATLGMAMALVGFAGLVASAHIARGRWKA